MTQHPQLDLQVAYCSLRGAEEGFDPEFGANLKWDVPLLDGYKWIRVPNKGTGDESFWGLYNPGLWTLIRDGKFDAVFCFTGYVRATFWIVYLASKAAHSAFLFGCDQNSLESRDGKQWKRWAKRMAWPLLYRLADQVVVSSSGARDLIASLGIPPDKITLTPLAVDNDWWYEASGKVNRDSVRSAWGVPRESFVVLYCAKLQAWKRPMDLLQAFAQARIENGHLVFAGAGPQREELEKEAKSLGVDERVRFLGFVNQSELPAVYTSADLMVMPSVYEPFGAVVGEASCCGCPVVATDRVGASRDLIAPIDPRLVYPCGERETLASILRALSLDPERLSQLREAVRRRMTEWSPQRNIAGNAEAVRVAVERRHSR